MSCPEKSELCSLLEKFMPCIDSVYKSSLDKYYKNIYIYIRNSSI